MDEKDLGRNISSGAEKVESIERRAELERQAAERRVQEARARLQGNKERKKRYRESLEELVQRNGQNADGGGKKGRGDGLGGWIAAVVSLGTISLILTAVLTVGAINMSRDNAIRAGEYRGIVYEVIHIAEQVDDDLEALRISEDPTKQMELFHY